MEAATGFRQGSRPGWGKPNRVVESGAERAVEAAGGEAKQQAGTIDPGMGELERVCSLRARERPLASFRSHVEASAAACRGALIRQIRKGSVGELSGETHGGFIAHCPGPCIPAAGKAGNKSDRSHVVL